MPETLITLTPEQAATLVAQTDATDLKHDARSHVRRVTDAQGNPWVVKTFLHARWKQRFTQKIGQHPAQLEARWHANLQKANVPVVPIAAQGFDHSGAGWIITPWMGESLHNTLAQGHADTPAQRHRLTRAVGTLTGRLLSQKLFNRDHKASNIVIDPHSGELRLIDAGGCRSAKGRPLLLSALPMLSNLNNALSTAATRHPRPHQARPSRADRLRFLRSVYAAWPTPPDGLQHLLRHDAFDTPS
ncbi:MAG: hypothetical protein V3V20_10980 [Algisphaera sp.]